MKHISFFGDVQTQTFDHTAGKANVLLFLKRTMKLLLVFLEIKHFHAFTVPPLPIYNSNTRAYIITEIEKNMINADYA